MAHIRSIVPQRNGVAPVDNNTVALFHFDHDAKDSIQGVKPIGSKTALDFNRTNTYIDISSVDYSEVLDKEITLAAWVYPTATTASSGGFNIISKNANSGFRYRIDYDGSLWFLINDGSGHEVYDPGTSVYTFSTDKWVHYAVTANLVSKQIKFYIDGVLISTMTSNKTAIAASSSYLAIGSYGGTNEMFKGRISDAQIWNRELSESEIQDIKRGEVSKDGLIGRWKLDESEGSIAQDYSAYGNDGIIQGEVSWVEGPSIYTLSKEGFPGGTIKYQDAAENLINNHDLTTWASYNGGVATASGDYFTLDGAVQNGGIYYETGFDLEIGTEYMYSWYARYVSGATNIGGHTGPGNSGNTIRVDGGSWTTADAIDIPQDEQWHRVELRFTPTDGYTDDNIYIQIGRGGGGAGVMDVKNVQLETSSYATDYVRGKRSARASYGGGVVVEEGTTNMVSSPFDLTSGYTGSTSGLENAGLLNFTGDNNAGTFTSDTSAWIAKVSGTGSKIDGQQYTTSWYLKAGTLSQATIGWGGSHTGTKSSMVVNLLDGSIESLNLVSGENYGVEKMPNGFWRCWLSSTLSGGTTYYPQLNLSGTGYIVIGGMQIEQKSFATSFVDGSRGEPRLLYPLNFNMDSFTLSFWAKVDTDAGAFPFYVNIYPDGEIDDSKRVYIRPTHGTELRAGSVGPTAGLVGGISGILDWHFYALTVSPGLMEMYYDGQKIGSSSVTAATGNNPLLDICGLSGNYGNDGRVLFDEIRIDKIARKEAEIASWYYQGRNGWE